MKNNKKLTLSKRGKKLFKIYAMSIFTFQMRNQNMNEMDIPFGKSRHVHRTWGVDSQKIVDGHLKNVRQFNEILGRGGRNAHLPRIDAGARDPQTFCKLGLCQRILLP